MATGREGLRPGEGWHVLGVVCHVRWEHDLVIVLVWKLWLKGAASKACGGAGATPVGVVALCDGWATVPRTLCVAGRGHCQRRLCLRPGGQKGAQTLRW